MTLLSIDSLHLVESSVKNKGSTDDGVRTWSTAVQILLPVAALAILWGRRGFFARFFLQFDKNCVSVFCPPFSKRQRLLKWASGRLPPTWSSHANTFPGGPAEFWRDGSLLCTLINSAIPGACPNPHRHWKRPPSHGQALAYKYLGVVPVFTETELNQNGLTLRHEGALINYLLKIQQAITNISNNELKFSSRYVARGMGLMVGEQHRQTAFYIYSSSTTSSSKHDVMVSIRGPYDTHCTATIPAYYISRKHLRNYSEDKQRSPFESRAQRSFLRSLSVDLGSFINLNQKQEIDSDIPIKLISESGRVKVIFIPKIAGVHEISIITNGFHLVGSPFNINITVNTSELTDTFDESFRCPYKKIKTKVTKKKIISKIIDFIDEKINYESLKIKPLYEGSIPEIKITQTKDASQESSIDEDNSWNTDNKNQAALHSSILIQSLNVEESATEETLANNFPNIDEDCEPAPEHNDTAEDNYLTIQSNILKEVSDVSVNISSSSCIEEIDEEIFNIVVTPNKSLNDDCNNNLIVGDCISSTIKDFPCKSHNNPTSPICFDHIEEEVTDEPNESSKVPNWNFEKKPLRRQTKIDLSDELDIGEYYCELNKDVLAPEISLNGDEEIDENQTENEELKRSLRPDWNIVEDSTISDQEIVDSTATKKNIFVVDEINENLEGQDDFTTKKQLADSGTILDLGKEASSAQNSMNILNYLSSLKTEDSHTQYIKTPPTVKTSDLSSANQQQEHIMSVKQRLQYWESQANLHISNKRQKLRLRRSLPNLLSSSESQFVAINSQNEDKLYNHKLKNNPEAVEFKTQFQKRQEYWIILSSQSIDCSSISSSMYYLETLGRVSKHRIKARRSLPDLFSKVSRNEVIDAMNYRNICFPIDFFDSPEAVKFKTRFKECREFWEKLSSQNLDFKASYESIEDDSYSQDNFDESNFDSGFYSSLPNLSTKHQNKNALEENSDSLKFKRQYEERREYWERLSLHSVSDLSLSSLLSTENNIADAADALGIKPVLIKSSNESQQKKLKTISETPKELGTNLDESLLRNDFCYSPGRKESTNLTDDLKQINDNREKMKIHFDEAKQFFQKLEESIK